MGKTGQASWYFRTCILTVEHLGGLSETGQLKNQLINTSVIWINQDMYKVGLVKQEMYTYSKTPWWVV